jgi:3-demethoxyubiquinol 3-hydroxylase
MLNLDRFILEFDQGLRTLFAQAHSARAHPDAVLGDVPLDASDQKKSAALMRVNHCGEVCAQALYQGQALTAKTPALQAQLRTAAQEETEHLAWTARRVHELGGHLSVLNPLCYGGSLAMGALAGWLGDQWNLGFLAETERQVGAHLQSHLSLLPAPDAKSRAIVQQMYVDETQHAEMAISLGGAALPPPVKWAMQANARLMTGAAYWV